jgi:hypothetical protein
MIFSFSLKKVVWTLPYIYYIVGVCNNAYIYIIWWVSVITRRHSLVIIKNRKRNMLSGALTTKRAQSKRSCIAWQRAISAGSYHTNFHEISRIEVSGRAYMTKPAIM